MSKLSELYFGPFRLQGRNGPLWRGDEEIKLQPRTLALLWTLVCQAGEVITKPALLDAVWPRQIVGEDALRFQIKALRRALDDDPKKPRYLLTAHRIGLKFGVPVTRGNAAVNRAESSSFVGREDDLQSLQIAWQSALSGSRQMIFVTGDAGIGKSALLATFRQQLGEQSPLSLKARGQCLEYTGNSEPYLPVLEALGALLREAQDSTSIELMRRVAPSWLLQLPDLMEQQEHEALKRQNAGVPKERMLREIAEAIEQLSAPHGLLLVLEDVHWSDAATLDLMAFLAQRQSSARLLVLASLRPVDAILAAHSVRKLQLTLKSRLQAREVALQGLSVDSVQRYLSNRLQQVEHRTELAVRVFERSGGLPLFMVQIVDYLLQHADQVDALSAQLHEVIPEALKDLISLQLNDLAPGDLQLLEAASVAGVEFSAAATAAALGLDQDAVEQQLERLADQPRFIESSGLAIWPDGTTVGTYRFRHAMYAQVLRRQVLESRRARMHRLIAERAETAFGARSTEIAGELALHFEQGGLRARALRYRIQTARKALDRVALEAVRQETVLGLQLLDALEPGLERDQAELALRVLAASADQTEHGFASRHAARHFERIALLVETCSEPQLLQGGLLRLWLRLHFQCRFEEALLYAEQLKQLGETLHSAVLAASGDTFAGVSLHLSGRFREADRHIASALSLLDGLDDSALGIATDIRTPALTGHAVLRWMLGYPDQALHSARAAHASAERSGNPYALCMGRVSSLNTILCYRRDWQRLLIESADSMQISEQYGHGASLSWARRQYAVALAMTGQADQGLPLLWQTLQALQEQDSLLGLPMDYMLGAECCIGRGDLAQARWALDAAWAIIHSNQTMAFESEARRLEGELVLAQMLAESDTLSLPTIVVAESHFVQALQRARSRHAPILQLRAAVGLGRLWQQQGRYQQALQQLQPLYDGFTEGHDSPDLVLAQALIIQLQACQPASP